MSEVDPDLVVPFMMRAWMTRIEEYCDKVDAYLTEVERRLAVLEVQVCGRR